MFWQIYQKLMMFSGFLSSGNLCLIPHLKLFWPKTASDKKCQNFWRFLLNFFPIFANFSFDSETMWLKKCRGWQLAWYHQDWSSFAVITQVFATFLRSYFYVFHQLFLKNPCRNQTLCWLYQTSCCSQRIFSYLYKVRIKRKIKQKLDKIRAETSLNFDTFYLRPLRPGEVKKVSNGWSGINFRNSGSHWTSVFDRFVKTCGLEF